MAWHVVIAGGGFGGFYAARTLERTLPPQAARITLVNDVNFMLYTPLLPGAAGGTLEPRHVVVPLREELKRTHLRLGTVVSGTPSDQALQVRTPKGTVETLTYDHLVVAMGSVSRTLPIPGLAEHGIGFKSLPEAIELRNHVLRTLEVAETLDDAEERKQWLTYVFVGAGYAGLEGLAELQDFAADVIDLYPRCRTQGMRWILVEARDRVMPEIPAQLADFATRELRGRGIAIRTSTTLESVTADTVVLSVASPSHAHASSGPPASSRIRSSARLGLPLDERGGSSVDRTLRVDGHEHVWALGDAAWSRTRPRRARPRRRRPPSTRFARGKLAGRNVAASIGNGRVKPFTFKTKGVFVDMGQGQAVATTLGIRWRGIPAWWLARSYHLALLPGTKRKLRLLVDWNIQLLFGRDASELGGLGRAPGLGVDPTGGGTLAAAEGNGATAPDGAPAPVAPS